SRVAVLIGGTRGLGAERVASLVSRRCEVALTYVRGRKEALGLAPEYGADVLAMRADGGNVAACTAVAEEVLKRWDHMDILVCNAAPPMAPVRVDAGSVVRIQDHVRRALALVAAPLGVFLPRMQSRSGDVVLVSSAYVRDFPAEWPQYVAAKSATEGLLRVAALQYPGLRFIILRPPRLQTDMTNSPTGWLSATPPAVVAEALAEYLASGHGGVRISTNVALIEEFQY
ncbi:MAG: SDR family oxidoreductase, partial [Chloroflexota bacterium]|nr:SDR family oxidoreductase [Chloroflexota bacterium]